MRFSRRSDIVIQRLFGEVLHGTKGAGGRLPPALAIAREYGISVASIREALKVLESIGIVTLSQGRGTLVESPGEIVDEIVETRRVIECSNAAHAAVNRSDDDVRTLGVILANLDRTFEANHIEAYSGHDHDLHVFISSLSGNRILRKTLENIRVVLYFQQTEVNRMPESLRESHRAHHELIDAIIAGDPDRAARVMADHLDKVGSALKRSVRSGRTPRELPRTMRIGSP